MLLLSVLKILSKIISTTQFLPCIELKNKIQLINTYNPSFSSTYELLVSFFLRTKVIFNFRGVDIYLIPILQLINDICFIFSKNILVNSRDMIDRYKKNSYLPQTFFSN